MENGQMQATSKTVTKTHDLTRGWKMTELDNGSLAFICDDPSVQGIALNPEQAARLREIVRSTDEEGRPTRITMGMLGG
jgi:hypothetical protein